MRYPFRHSHNELSSDSNTLTSHPALQSTDVNNMWGYVNQTYGLYRKSLLLLWRSWFWTAFRAWILPIAFIVFMGYAKNFFVPFAIYGVAVPYPIQPLSQVIGDGVIAWYSRDPNGITPEMDSIMNRAFSGLPSDRIYRIEDESEIFSLCAQNLRGASKCYGGLQWNSIDQTTNTYNYTIRGNFGLSYINVRDHNSATDIYVLPLQWAVESAITNISETPYSIPFTSESEQDHQHTVMVTFLNTVINWLSPALFLGMIGVIYHLTGVIAQERELGISSLLSGMGTSQFSRFSSFFLSFSTVYFMGWISIALSLGLELFKETNIAIIIFYHIFSGFSMISWSLFLGSLFKKAQVSGIISAGLSVLLALMSTVQTRVPSNGSYNAAAIYFLSILFPPMNYSYFIQLLSRFQREGVATNLVEIAPTSNVYGIVIFLATLFQTVFYFAAAMVSEKILFGTFKKPVLGASGTNAVEVTGLYKSYKVGKFNRKPPIIAVNDLNLSVVHGQILCLLGANGSGKTTTLEMIAGIQTPTWGTIKFDWGTKLGICPQKNVMWDHLTTREHVELWARLKGVNSKDIKKVADNLIQKCDLAGKEDTHSKNLSGGQKRKLQLAIMFAGGSNVCCIDEVSSGLDPLSRRKIWDIILAHRETHTMILTTHFLDEADILSDKVSILSRGVLKAEGTTVFLKETMGGGYRIFVSHPATGHEQIIELDNAAQVYEAISSLEENDKAFRVAGPQLEDVFLKVAKNDHDLVENPEEIAFDFSDKSNDAFGINNEEIDERLDENADSFEQYAHESIGMLGQTLALLRKRYIIFRRNPLPEIAFFVLPLIVAGACSGFLRSFAGSSCTTADRYSVQKYSHLNLVDVNLSIPVGPSGVYNNSSDGVDNFLSGIISRTGININISSTASDYITQKVSMLNSYQEFLAFISANHSTIVPGGFYIQDSPAIAYQADSNAGVFYAPMILSFLNNVRANGTVQLIADFSPFQVPWSEDTGDTLQFVGYFGLAVSVAPAFAALYPTFERLSKVRAMHYSNGLRVPPLWTAYTLFNLFLGIVISVAVTGIMAGSTSHLMGAGYLFVCLLLYTVAAVLMSFVISLFVQSQLAAFAITAAFQTIYFLIYLIGYLATLVFGKPATIDRNVLIIHFTLAVVAPISSLVRAMFMSLNLFGVLCRNNQTQIEYLGDILAYGGPVLYLVVQIIVYYTFLVLYESDRINWLWARKMTNSTERALKRQFYRLLRRTNKNARASSDIEEKLPIPQEVVEETQLVESQPMLYSDGLRLVHVSKEYGTNRVTEDISFGVRKGECFALLGPNGAGKTTTFDMIRGETPPTTGEISVNGISVGKERSLARTRLGVCPQFDAMDKMLVKEILNFYARLRGIRGQKNVSSHVDNIIEAVGLGRFRQRMANKLSGGNKRKLSLAIALIGNPAVLLLDEPSSGMDAFAKRIMWSTLATVSRGKSIILTTHSMEEADSLANRAGIIAKRMLAVGTTDYLRTEYGKAYHVHLVCKSAPMTPKEEMEALVQWFYSQLPGSQVEDRMYQGQVKLSVPLGNRTRVSTLFKLLETNKENLQIESYSVSPTSLEEVFLRIVGQHDVTEEGFH